MTPRYGPCEPAELRARMARAVASLGQNEVRKIVEEQGKVEVTCEFCKETIELREHELTAAAANAV